MGGYNKKRRGYYMSKSKKKSFLSAGSRFAGLIKAIIIFAIIAVVGAIIFAIVGKDATFIFGFAFMTGIVNVIFYFLFNWIAARGGKLGKIAFFIALAIEAVFIILGIASIGNKAIFFSSANTFLGRTGYVGMIICVPLLLNLYVLDYSDFTSFDYLNGYNRHFYGLYGTVVSGVVAIVLAILLKDLNLLSIITLLIAIGVNVITVLTWIKMGIPFSKMEITTGSSSSSSSSRSSSSYSSSSSTNQGGYTDVYSRMESLCYDMAENKSLNFGDVDFQVSLVNITSNTINFRVDYRTELRAEKESELYEFNRFLEQAMRNKLSEVSRKAKNELKNLNVSTNYSVNVESGRKLN